VCVVACVQCVAVCGSVCGGVVSAQSPAPQRCCDAVCVQCVVVCGSVFQCVRWCASCWKAGITLLCAVLCCSVLQCVVVSCSLLQCMVWRGELKRGSSICERDVRIHTYVYI